MGSHTDYLNKPLVSLNSIYDAVLAAESRRAMPAPLSPQFLIVKSLDLSKTTRPGESDDILPLLVTFQDVDRESVELLPGPSVLEDFPHTEKSMYTLFGMSMSDLSNVT